MGSLMNNPAWFVVESSRAELAAEWLVAGVHADVPVKTRLGGK